MFDRNRRMQETYRQRRAEWLATNGPCTRCGSWDDLQVDHIDPTTKDPMLTKSGNPNGRRSLWRWSAERRAIELAKCQVLCADCHKVKSRAEESEYVRRRTRDAHGRFA